MAGSGINPGLPEPKDLDMTPPTATCSVGLVDWRLPVTGTDAIRLTRAVGAGGVQLDLGGPGRGEWIDARGHIAELRRTAQENQIQLLAVAGNHLNDVGITAPAGTPEAVRVRELLERTLDAAHELGCPLAFVPSFRRSAIDGPRALDRTVEVLSWAAAQAQDRGITLANENVLDPAGARTLLNGVNSPVFRLLLDTLNPVLAGIDPSDLIQELSPHFADQIHFKDGPPDTGTTPLLGTGTSYPLRTLTALRTHRNPVRTLVLENDYRDGDRTRLRADLSWLRKHAEELPPELDEAGT